MAKDATNPVADMSRRKQIVESYRLTKRTDPRIGWILLAVFLVFGALGFGLFYVLPGGGVIGWVLAGVGGFMIGLVATLTVFGRRAQKSAFAQMEGRPGAAASALGMLRRGWKVDQVVAFTKQQDMVHRVVGPPGIVLVGEGNINRLRPLLTAERRRHERVLDGTPVHEIIVGDAEGQVPLPKVLRHVQKLGRDVKPAEITEVLNRLKALDANRSVMPLPKGPIPTSMKGMRGNMRGR
jgi:hypothetical protein